MSYAVDAADALEAIAEEGAEFPLTRVIAGIKDPVSQTATPSTSQTQTVVAVVLPATESRDMTMEQRTLVRTNRRLLYIAPSKADGSALDFEPQSEYVIRFENDDWRLGGVSRLGPDGDAPVLFTAEAKR